MKYEVFELGKSHGEFDTLDEARGCVAFDRLKFWAIWIGDTQVDCSLWSPSSPSGQGRSARCAS